jgi:hypothetical protein
MSAVSAEEEAAESRSPPETKALTRNPGRYAYPRSHISQPESFMQTDPCRQITHRPSGLVILPEWFSNIVGHYTDICPHKEPQVDGLQQPVGHTEVDSQPENNLYSVVQIAVVGQIASVPIVPYAAPPRTG